MADIGTLEYLPGNNAFRGCIRTRTFSAPIRMTARAQHGPDSPDWTVETRSEVDGGVCPCGVAWNKTSAKGTQYISFRFDEPDWPDRLRSVSAFERNETSWVIVWDLPKAKPEPKAKEDGSEAVQEEIVF